MKYPTFNGRFDGYPAEISTGKTDQPTRIDICYGGSGGLMGRGHGHVVSKDGINIFFWRLPESEGGGIIIDDNMVSTP